MEIYTEHECVEVWAAIIARLRASDLAILPTDTIYGLSGNALDPALVSRVLHIKRRTEPVSIIPHALEWARLLVHESERDLFDARIEEFVGAYTTLWRTTDRSVRLPDAIASSGYIGLRQPAHWISDLARELGFPLVTTSANVHGRPPMTSLEDLDADIRAGVDFAVYEGPLAHAPSTLVRVDADGRLVMESRKS